MYLMNRQQIRFNKHFRDANETRCRYRVLMGSAGSGKSVNVAQKYILDLTDKRNAGRSLMCVRGVEVSHLNSTFAELSGAIYRMGLENIWRINPSKLSMSYPENGNYIMFRGCNDQKAIERLKSVTVPEGKITDVWCEEATELRVDDFNIIDDRLRGTLPYGQNYQITLTFNPINSAHWIKHQLWDYQSDDIFTHKSTYLDNSFIDDAYKKRMLRRKELDPDGYRVYGLGEWGETGGLIYPNVKFGNYANMEFEDYTIGTDWGFNHYHATILIGWKDGEPYALREVAVQGLTTSQIIEKCNEACIPKNVIMHCDSAEPDRIKEFKKAGYMAYPVKKEQTGKGSVKNQIAWLKDRMIHIDGRCEQLHKEIIQYTYKKDPTTGKFTEEPITVNDDAIKALTYGCESVRKANKLKTLGKETFSIW